jgi:hypothetical protein
MDAVGPPPLDIPPELGLDAAATARRFLIRGEHANLWFEGGGPDLDGALVVSFDNLATIDEGWPRGPWAWKRLEPMGHAVLGVQSHAKDWFRQPTAPALLRSLEERGFFRRFRRVVLTGRFDGGLRRAELRAADPRGPGAGLFAADHDEQGHRAL